MAMKIFIDSEGLDNYLKDMTPLKKLLCYNTEPFEFFRTNFETSNEDILKIKEIESISFNSNQEETILRMYNDLKFHPRNEGQRQFFYSMLKYANGKSQDYLIESVYVTENPIYFEKFIHGGEKKYSLKDLYPSLILVNVKDTVKILDIYARKNGYFIFEQKLEKNENLRYASYFIKIISTFPNLASFSNKADEKGYDRKYIDSLTFRLLKLLLCIDFLGYEHYFETQKIKPASPETLKEGIEKYKKADPNAVLSLSGLVNPNTQHILFYNAEYFPSLVTGVFDNLAILTANLYGINVDPIRVSLSSDSGRDFLDQLSQINTKLKQVVDQNLLIRNLIYYFRERVIHREGLLRRELPIAPNWTNFFKIDDVIHCYVKQCGDSKSVYKYITEWGIVVKDWGIYMDPYYFSSQFFDRLVNFVEAYLNELVVALDQIQ